MIQTSEQVLVADCTRLGINVGGDTYYSGAALVKKRVCENFEGTSYRQCHFGPLLSDGEFHNLGVPPPGGGAPTDSARYQGARSVSAPGPYHLVTGR